MTSKERKAVLPSPSHRIVFPWRYVVGDNHRLQPARGRRGMVMTKGYREAKAAMALIAMAMWVGAPLTGDVCLTARCWFPDKRRRDAANYRKAVTDSLTGICYDDDAQLVSELWLRAGYSKTEPRIEITLQSTPDWGGDAR